MRHLQNEGEGYVRPHVEQLVINWHITEACNYSCRYCYAKWDDKGRELIHDWNRVRNLIDQIHSFFHPRNLASPLRKQMTWSGLRLNLAGGEPLLYPEAALRVLAYAKSKGMATSIITNGSRLTDELVDMLAPQVSVLGLSVDSTSSQANIRIGRIDRQGRLLDEDRISGLLLRARLQNPSLQLKVNTVVNALNCHKDLSSLIGALEPDRWKVLRMLEVVTSELAVSSEDFHAFVARHAEHREVMCIEDNDAMSESYIMIDPLGRFFQNASNQRGYQYSESINEVGAESAFTSWRLSVDAYTSRYPLLASEEGI
ncbi:hypothetical protein LCGC14_1900810 [marine sediment metagenome]|uniref:Radical SAM core domain-containing protein n=1 Tax=marine sediment metagenome TaxID=412755 RepID=A0A0F9IAK5_9ZZZZ